MESDQYGSIAPFYDPIISPILRALRHDIATYIRFRKHRRILDVCCGTGSQLQMLAAPGMQLSGIDNSLAMLEQAQRKSAKDIKFHLLDVEQSVLAHANFDCAILSFALHEKHPGARQAVYANTLAMVRPGGSLVIADFSRVPKTVTGFIYGRIAVPFVERLAGKHHYQMYAQWMAEGALEGFLNRQGVASDIICRPFKRSVLCCAVDVPTPGLSLQNSLVLLNQSMPGSGRKIEETVHGSV